MHRRLSTVLILVLLASGCGLYPPTSGTKPKPKPVPTPVVVVVVEPSTEFKAKVAPLTNDLKGHGSDARMLSAYFTDWAEIIKRDDDVVKNHGQLKLGLNRSMELLVENTDFKGKYPSMKSLPDQLLLNALGKEDKLLTTETRKKAAEVFEALAWACAEATK